MLLEQYNLLMGEKLGILMKEGLFISQEFIKIQIKGLMHMSQWE